jgi:hypothetical protein
MLGYWVVRTKLLITKAEVSSKVLFLLSTNSSRSNLAVAASIIIAGVLISASLLVVFTRSQVTTTDTKTITSTSTVTLPGDGGCLKQVPQGSSFSSLSNSTAVGMSVTYPNGTTAFFPLDSCPVPVTPANYIIDSTIESNPRFIAAENGSIYEAGNACNCSSSSATMSNSTGFYDVFSFALYSSQRVYPCGSTSFWTYNELGVLQVDIQVNPSTGSLEFSSLQVQQGAANVFLCTTTTHTS